MQMSRRALEMVLIGTLSTSVSPPYRDATRMISWQSCDAGESGSASSPQFMAIDPAQIPKDRSVRNIDCEDESGGDDDDE